MTEMSNKDENSSGTEAEFISIKEYCLRNHFCDRTVRRWIKDKKIDAKRFQPRGKWFVANEPAEIVKKKSKPRSTHAVHHAEDLVGMARKIVQHWMNYMQLVSENRESSDKYFVTMDEFWRIDSDIAECLFQHIKHAHPASFKQNSSWTSLVEKEYDLMDILRSIAYKRDIKGTCDLCKDW